MTNATDPEQMRADASNLISQGKMEEANEYLSKALIDHPSSAQLHFLQAAVCAQLASYDDAVAHYQQALTLEPQLFIARFQLGLLLATLGENEACISTLEVLTTLEANYLSAFSKGIIFTLTNQLDEAEENISAGLETNNENPSLNKDMRAMLGRIQDERNTTSEKEEADITKIVEKSDAPESSEPDQSHLLDIYQTKH